MEAGFKGSKEIIFAIISTTITLAAVFLPIIFLQGLTVNSSGSLVWSWPGCADFRLCLPDTHPDAGS
jgi:hypothetical protein